jgi:cytidine deaminase
MDAARQTAKVAYAPYSEFNVGAAVRGDDGKIYTGCNIENASYGLAICAERTAIFTAISNGCRTITQVAVTCPNAPAESPPTFRMPCGACLQVMSEFGTGSLSIDVDQVGTFALKELLPKPFEL